MVGGWGTFARRHARVDHPDGVCDKDCGGAGEGAGGHGLEGGEFGTRAAGFGGGAFEGGARPLVPVIINEVGDADAKDGAVETRVEAGEALTLDDAADSVWDGGTRPFRLDLGARGEGDEGVCQDHGENPTTWISGLERSVMATRH